MTSALKLILTPQKSSPSTYLISRSMFVFTANKLRKVASDREMLNSVINMTIETSELNSMKRSCDLLFQNNSSKKPSKLSLNTRPVTYDG